MSTIIRLETISQAHEALSLDKPRHPLVSVVPIDERILNFDYGNATYVFGFYQVSMKSDIPGAMRYGRNSYDFQEGSMVFTKPGQAMSFTMESNPSSGSGWTLMFHPDLIRRLELGRSIERYSYFSFDVHEALHLSHDEREALTEITSKIKREYSQNIDRHSQKLIVANIELLLDYCTRYYDRQFYTRSNLNQDFVSKFEQVLSDYFQSDKPLELGLPTVTYCGEAMRMSPAYLSDLLKKETGRSARQHIQDALVDRAKTMLLGGEDQVSQIAYTLGFEYPQHFSKLFKAKTGMSPVSYRKAN